MGASHTQRFATDVATSHRPLLQGRDKAVAVTSVFRQTNTNYVGVKRPFAAEPGLTHGLYGGGLPFEPASAGGFSEGPFVAVGEDDVVDDISGAGVAHHPVTLKRVACG